MNYYINICHADIDTDGVAMDIVPESKFCQEGADST